MMDLTRLILKYSRWPAEEAEDFHPSMNIGYNLIVKRIHQEESNDQDSCDLECWYYRVGNAYKKLVSQGFMKGLQIIPDHGVFQLEKYACDALLEKDELYDMLNSVKEIRYVESVYVGHVYMSSLWLLRFYIVCPPGTIDARMEEIKGMLGYDANIEVRKVDPIIKESLPSNYRHLLAAKIKFTDVTGKALLTHLPNFTEKMIARYWNRLIEKRAFSVVPMFDTTHLQRQRCIMVYFKGVKDYAILDYNFKTVCADRIVISDARDSEQIAYLLFLESEREVEQVHNVVKDERFASLSTSIIITDTLSVMDYSRDIDYLGINAPANGEVDLFPEPENNIIERNG